MIYRLAVCVLLPCVAALSSPVAPGLQRTCVSRLPASRVSPRAAVLMCAEAAAEEATEVAADAAAEEAPKKGKKGNRTPIADLEEGAEIQGTVRSVMAYGAFVDIGASTDGLLHVSEIANEYVKDANDKLSAGDAVTVRIKSVNVDKNQVALTAKDPNAAPAPRGGGGGRKARADLSKYADADEKEFVAGTVSSIADFGAFVTLEEGVDGLLHISQIAEGGVSSVGDVLSVGQEVQVRVTSVDVGSRRIGLSMKPWTDAPPPEKRGGGGRGKGGGGKRISREEQEEAELKLSPEEIAELEGDDDAPAPSAFESAFARAALVQQAKAEGGRYEKQVL